MIGSGGGNFGFDMGALLGNMMGNGGNGWGNNGGLWAIILIIALCGGFGRNGGGLFGNNGSGSDTTVALDASLQRGFDTQSIISKLDGITGGICNLGYDQLNQMNNISNTVTQTGNQLQTSLQNLMVALMQQGFAQSTQAQQCCCNIENLLQQANYNRQADTCAITTAIQQAAQSIMQNDNCNYRQLHDEQVALQLQGKDAQIAQLTAALGKCDTQAIAANAVQSAVAQLKDPPPQPAYVVPNPNAVFPFFGPWSGWGWGNQCCGNNGNFFGFS